MQPVQVTMRPLPATPASPPLPARWAEAVRNVEEAQTTLLGVIETLDSALYLDEETWQHALPHAQFVAALQVRGPAAAAAAAAAAKMPLPPPPLPLSPPFRLSASDRRASSARSRRCSSN